ncbi:hypothetical protein BLNAU_18652 [Blattamonas nauphoetae]|uniref:Uncharacterized protein n=1 Tax=Blattamonas nauphoetae TaxID=2049346 RepID=A0ABQ9X3Q1_9EUKA|nr:hypothetical protein BLNAU_18652 [Blattamonas nauphoetae]
MILYLVRNIIDNFMIWRYIVHGFGSLTGPTHNIIFTDHITHTEWESTSLFKQNWETSLLQPSALVGVVRERPNGTGHPSADTQNENIVSLPKQPRSEETSNTGAGLLKSPQTKNRTLSTDSPFAFTPLPAICTPLLSPAVTAGSQLTGPSMAAASHTDWTGHGEKKEDRRAQSQHRQEEATPTTDAHRADDGMKLATGEVSNAAQLSVTLETDWMGEEPTVAAPTPAKPSAQTQPDEREWTQVSSSLFGGEELTPNTKTPSEGEVERE